MSSGEDEPASEMSSGDHPHSSGDKSDRSCSSGGEESSGSGYSVGEKFSEDEVEPEAAVVEPEVDDDLDDTDVIMSSNIHGHDKIVDEISFPVDFGGHHGKLGTLNERLFQMYVKARNAVNQIYRADDFLRFNHSIDAERIKNNAFTVLCDLRDGNDGIPAIPSQICLLGGPFFAPPPILWKYLYHFWFEEDTDTVRQPLSTPEVPLVSVSDCFELPEPDIDVIVNALKVPGFVMLPRYHGPLNISLFREYNAMAGVCVKLWKSLREELDKGLSISSTTGDLYEQLSEAHKSCLKMIADAPDGATISKIPALIINAIDILKIEFD